MAIGWLLENILEISCKLGFIVKLWREFPSKDYYQMVSNFSQLLYVSGYNNDCPIFSLNFTVTIILKRIIILNIPVSRQ
jgi:hypothetical protein